MSLLRLDSVGACSSVVLALSLRTLVGKRSEEGNELREREVELRLLALAGGNPEAEALRAWKAAVSMGRRRGVL